MRPAQLLAAIATLSSVSAASWPDLLGNPKAVADINGLLRARDDSSSASPSASAAPKSDSKSQPASTAADSTAKATDSASASDSKDTAKVTGSAQASVTSVPKGGNHTISYDPRLPAGGISMVTPAALSGQQYYRIGDWVTFAWNYTSVSQMPNAVDILATCTANQATYTLAVNQTVDPTQTILWDTGAYQSNATVPLLTETYTLIVYDAESSVSATAQPGYLAPNSQFVFGMYTPQPYTNWSGYKCSTCNGALSAYDISVFKIIFLTCGTTIASFIYFGYSFGLF